MSQGFFGEAEIDEDAVAPFQKKPRPLRIVLGLRVQGLGTRFPSGTLLPLLFWGFFIKTE